MTEVLASNSLSITLFLELGADEKALGHSTLILCKNRLVKNTGLKATDELFDEIIPVAQEKSVKFGMVQVVVLLHGAGFDCSTSTVGRILHRLKERGVLREPVPYHISAGRRQRQRPYAVRKGHKEPILRNSTR